MSQAELDAVLARPDVWRGRQATWAECESSGFATLDAALGGGWPLGVLIECMGKQTAGTAITLFLPVLEKLMRQGRVVFVKPPCWPYAPALAQAGMALPRLLVLRPESLADWIWAAVQCLRSDDCRAVFLWQDELDYRVLRQLQLAAESSHALVVLLRPLTAIRGRSAAAVRLSVHSVAPRMLQLHLLKCHGRAPCKLELNINGWA